jgi:hypothetical protein
LDRPRFGPTTWTVQDSDDLDRPRLEPLGPARTRTTGTVQDSDHWDRPRIGPFGPTKYWTDHLDRPRLGSTTGTAPDPNQPLGPSKTRIDHMDRPRLGPTTWTVQDSDNHINMQLRSGPVLSADSRQRVVKWTHSGPQTAQWTSDRLPAGIQLCNRCSAAIHPLAQPLHTHALSWQSCPQAI